MNVTVGSTTRPSLRLSRFVGIIFGSLFLYGCTGGTSCDTGSGCINNYDYPQSDLTNGVQQVDDAARMRVTQAGLDFLATHIDDILLGALGDDPDYPGTIVVELEPAEVVSGVTLGQSDLETYPTRLLINADALVEDMTLRFVESGDQISAAGETITVPQDGFLMEVVDVPVGIDARLFTEVDLLLTSMVAACDIDGANDSYCSEEFPDCGIVSGLSFAVLIYPDVGSGNDCAVQGSECLLVSVDVVGVDFNPSGTLEAGSLEISVPPRCNVSNPSPDCSPECSDTFPITDPNGDAECDLICAVEEFGVDLFIGLVDLIEPLLQPFLDDLFETVIQQTLADYNRQPIAVADRIDLASLAEGAIPTATHEAGFNIQPSGNAFDVNCPSGMDCETSKGMDLILKTGVEAAPSQPQTLAIPHPCVRTIQGSDFINMYGGVDFELVTQPEPLTGEFDGENYHFAASIAEPSMNQGLFGVYNTGALCIEVSSDTVYSLTEGAFLLSAGTIDLLTEGKLRQYTDPSAPAIISLAPNEPPIITMGSGVGEDGHLNISWNKVDISFYVLMYERFTRVFSVQSDISLSTAVFFRPEDDVLEFAIVQGPTVDNFSEVYNELLPGVSFSEVLESLVGLAFDALLSDGLNVDIDIGEIFTDALGVPLYLDFKGIETLPTAEPEFLNVYVSLTEVPPSQNRTPFRSDLKPLPLPQSLYLDLPKTTDNGQLGTPGARALLRPSGQIQIQGHASTLDESVEYFARTDFGLWRGPLKPNADGQITVRDPKLSLLGKHTIALRARYAGQPASLEQNDHLVEVWLDPYRPKVNLSIAGDYAVATGTDRGSATDQLTWSWQEDDGAWSSFSSLRQIALAEVNQARLLRVRAKDPAGNISFPAAVDLNAAAISSANSNTIWAQQRQLKEEESGGCQQVSSWPIFGLAVLLGLFHGGRRWRFPLAKRK